MGELYCCQSELLFYHDQEQSVVYHPASGSTLLISNLMADVLEHIKQQPLDLNQIADQFDYHLEIFEKDHIANGLDRLAMEGVILKKVLFSLTHPADNETF